MSKISTVYTHLTTIGVRSQNNLHITTTIDLVAKRHWIVRLIHNIARALFGANNPNTQLDPVIFSAESAALKADPNEKHMAQFIVLVLKTIQSGDDPHLHILTGINRLTSRLANSTLSDEEKKEPLARLETIKKQYGNRDIALSVRNALDEIDLLEGLRDRNSNADHDLIYAVKGYKNSVAMMAGMLNPIIGLGIAATTYPESEKDLQNIDAALEKGADVNYKGDSSGYTALIYAAYYGYPGIARHLLFRGASPQIKDRDGYNAYTMAKYYENKYRKRLEEMEKRPLTATFTAEDKALQRKHYSADINRYAHVASMLEGITHDRTMPVERSWF